MEVDSASDFTIQTFQKRLFFEWGKAKVNKNEQIYSENSQFPGMIHWSRIYFGKRNRTDSTESSSFNSISSNRYTWDTKTLSPKDLFISCHDVPMKAPPRVCRPSSQEFTGLKRAIGHRLAKNGSTETNEHCACFFLVLFSHGSSTRVKMMELGVGAIPQHRPVLPQSCECT